MTNTRFWSIGRKDKKSREQRAKGREQRAESKGQRAERYSPDCSLYSLLLSALSSLLPALCPLLSAFYLAAMSRIKLLASLFWMFLCIGACKSGTAEKVNKEEIISTQDTVTHVVNAPAPFESVYVSGDMGVNWQPLNEGLPKDIHLTTIDQIGDELVAAGESGLFMTQNHLASWKDIGTGLATKKINALYVNGNELYICLFHEGVTRWVLGSPYWNSFTNNLTNKNVLSILKYKDELIVGNDVGIFKSSGHMQTWTGKHFGGKVFCLTIHGDTVLAGTSKGVMISIDGGEKWRSPHSFGQMYAFTILGKYVYAQYASGDLFISENGGNSWRAVDYGAKDQSPVYAIVKAGDQYLLSSRQGLFSSRNGKTGWTLISPQQNQWFSDLLMKDGKLYGIGSSE